MESVKHINQLGFEAKDKVTDFFGVITSVDFDLYGCIQYLIQPKAKDGREYGDSKWFDANRVVILSDERVMEIPDFDLGYVAEGNKGASEKPIK